MLKTFYISLFMLFSTFSFSQTVMSIIEDSPNHNTLESLINSAGLNATLSGAGTFTVFAPTDDAFAALDPALVNTLTSDPSGKLTKALLYHVLGNEVLSNTLTDGQKAMTLFGQDVTVTINQMMEVFINNGQVTTPDLGATNGVVHVIDAVILPPNVTVADVVINSDVHETLEGAVISADLATTLSDLNGNFTVFAPTDDAFAALDPAVLNILTSNADTKLRKALLYHVLGAEVMSSDLSDGQTATTIFGQDITVTIDGNGGVMINNANVVLADIPTLNGVVHVLDAVILPPNATVADVVINSDVHATLEGAVVAADLATTLSDLNGDFTVFAPTDDAFAALDPAVLNVLTSNADTKLRRALLYHVLGAEVLSSDLSDGQTATTLFGQDITVTIDGNGGVKINDANVAIADIPTLNGVVHVLDAVILPPNATVADVVINSDVHATLEGAVIAADLATTLSDLEGNFTVFAPTDDAFTALDASVLNVLTSNADTKLRRALLYHVLGAEVMSSDLSDGQTATTLFGQDITVTVDANGGVKINDANVAIADIQTLNGVVHVLDAVILPPNATVADVVINSEVHETLEGAVVAADLATTLSDLAGNFTVFAPTDDAFAALDPAVLNILTSNADTKLRRALLYHVLGAEVMSADLTDGQTATTLFDQDITVTIDANGGVMINNANVAIADIQTLNGVVHVLDAVIFPPNTTVADVVINSDVHETLEGAVVSADLATTLSDLAGNFTVFAPTDDAFAALDATVLNILTSNADTKLRRALLYHVLGAEVLSSDLSDGQTATTLFDQDITVTIDANGGVMINNANVSIADITTLNGIVHVLDAVILPPNATVADVVINSPDHTTLETAVVEAQLAGALGDLSADYTVFAPNDDAFAPVDVATLLTDPTGDLQKILQYHVLDSEVFSTDLTDGQVATTLLGQDISVGIDANGAVTINGNALVIAADITTLNGVVHVLNNVLLPDLTSIKDLNQVNLNVFPNPTTDFITIDLPTEMIDQVVDAQLIGTQGNVLRTWQINDVNPTIDVTKYTAGTYFILLRTDKNYALSTVVIK